MTGDRTPQPIEPEVLATIRAEAVTGLYGRFHDDVNALLDHIDHQADRISALTIDVEAKAEEVFAWRQAASVAEDYLGGYK